MSVRRSVEIKMPCTSRELKHFSAEVDRMTDHDGDVKIYNRNTDYVHYLAAEWDVEE